MPKSMHGGRVAQRVRRDPSRRERWVTGPCPTTGLPNHRLPNGTGNGDFVDIFC